MWWCVKMAGRCSLVPRPGLRFGMGVGTDACASVGLGHEWDNRSQRGYALGARVCAPTGRSDDPIWGLVSAGSQRLGGRSLCVCTVHVLGHTEGKCFPASAEPCRHALPGLLTRLSSPFRAPPHPSNVATLPPASPAPLTPLPSQRHAPLYPATPPFQVGMMGSGKSTVGKMLANTLKYAFFDTDSVIELAHDKKPVSQIFAEEGQDYFRQCESQVRRAANSRHARRGARVAGFVGAWGGMGRGGLQCTWTLVY